MCFTGLKSWTSEAPVVRMVFLVEIGSPLALLVVGKDSILLWCGVLVRNCKIIRARQPTSWCCNHSGFINSSMQCHQEPIRLDTPGYRVL